MARSLLFNTKLLRDCMRLSKKHFWSRTLTYRCFFARRAVIILCSNLSIMIVVIYHSAQTSGSTFFCLSLHLTTFSMRSHGGCKKTDHSNEKRHSIFLVNKWRSSRVWDKKLIPRHQKAIDFWLAIAISFVPPCFRSKLYSLSSKMNQKRCMRVIEYIYLPRPVRWH